MSIAAYPTYESYTDSSVRWIGKFPSRWELSRLGGLFDERRKKVSDTDFEPLSVTKNGIFPQLETAAKTNDGDNRKLVKAGDFVINSRSDRKGSSGVSPLDGSVSLINIVLEPKRILPEFCHHLLKSYGFVEEYYRVGRGIVADLWTTRYDEMRTILVALPSPEEQRVIASFLDEKCAKIDEAVRIKEEQIKLLRERRQILIQQAVTRGLNPDAPMKDSGIDWIGQIPAHWEVRKVKQIFRLVADAAENNNSHELLSIYTDIGVRPRKDLEERGNKASTTDGYWMVKKGDFIVNKLLAWMGAIGLSEYDGVTSPAYDILRPQEPINGQFFHRLFRSKSFSLEIKRFSRGIMEMRLRIYFDKLGVLLVPFPPKSEQDEIISYLDIHEQKIDSAISIKENQITALKEYKTTLINAAVTGKIKIPKDRR